MSIYDFAFFEYVNKGSSASAATIIPLVKSYFNVRSVIDFGCGQGAWLREWRRSGAQEVLGLDGDYVDKDALLIDSSELQVSDLANPVDLGKKFDLVESLEVAEHLPEFKQPAPSLKVWLGTATSSCSPPPPLARAGTITSMSSRTNTGGISSSRMIMF